MHNSEFINAEDVVKGKKVVILGSNKGAADMIT